MKMYDNPPYGFWIGCRVLRLFGDKTCIYTVDNVDIDEDKLYFQVTFDNFDE